MLVWCRVYIHTPDVQPDYFRCISSHGYVFSMSVLRTWLYTYNYKHLYSYICIDIYTYIHPCYKFYRADLFMCVWCLYLSTVFCISIRWHQTLFLRHLCQRQSRCCLCCAVGLSTNERCPFRILCIIGGSLSMRLILFQYRQSHF